MNKGATFLFFTAVSFIAIFFVTAPLFAVSNLSKTNTINQTASVFFAESASPEILKQDAATSFFTAKKIRILVVPGHDSENWGTQFNGIKEADMTLSLGQELTRLLSQDSQFEVVISRDSSGYTSTFSNYFSEQGDKILEFVNEKKKIMSDLVDLGQISKIKEADKVYHNTAPKPVAIHLYGINKWADENNINLVVHIHFNDYPRRKRAVAGEYSGISVYVPEHQYSNARASKEIADLVSKQLLSYSPNSNLPKEGAGVVEDQDLIAIGAFNTLDPASILVEYGYIYEPQFLEPIIREKIIKELAYQTYIGIHNFFLGAGTSPVGKFNTTLLPHTWESMIKAGTKHDSSILSLQAALVLDGVYPPADSDLHVCPIAGTFGKCTWKSLSEFQKKYGVLDEVGVLGKNTIEKLNELYGQ